MRVQYECSSAFRSLFKLNACVHDVYFEAAREQYAHTGAISQTVYSDAEQLPFSVPYNHDPVRLAWFRIFWVRTHPLLPKMYVGLVRHGSAACTRDAAGFMIDPGRYEEEQYYKCGGLLTWLIGYLRMSEIMYRCEAHGLKCRELGRHSLLYQLPTTLRLIIEEAQSLMPLDPVTPAMLQQLARATTLQYQLDAIDALQRSTKTESRGRVLRIRHSDAVAGSE